MDILLTGRLAGLTPSVSDQLVRNHKVVMASNDLIAPGKGKAVTPFRISPHEDGFEKIFHSYAFETVLFFAQPLYTQQEYFEEYRDLECCLRLCDKHDVHKVIYLLPSYQGSASSSLPDYDLGMLFSACEQLCASYRARKNIAVLLMYLPSLFGYGESVSLIGDAISQAKSRAAIHFPAPEDQRGGFLSQADLGELLLRMVESWPLGYEKIRVPAATVLTFGELGALFSRQFPTVRLSYAPAALGMDTDVSQDVPRREFDWIPLRGLEEEFPALIQRTEDAAVEEKRPFWSAVGAFFKRHSFIVKLAELLIGFLLMEFLNRITSTTVQFRYIDFRLIYIVLMGTMHGMKTGLGASALASLSLLVSSITTENNWQATLYDIDTWLPFIFFFLIGAVTGYVKDRLRNDNRFIVEEKAILEDKYILLNEFYASALHNKEQYKSQIMSYRDSFGRLFDITKSLDSTLIDEVFSEALTALEGVLDNKSVCIYQCDEKMLFGRLIACSKEIVDVTQKSLNLSKLEKMTDEFTDGEVWVNRERLLGYPEYAVPLYRGEAPIALIVLQKVKYEQMAVYYENLVKIICGLVKISLIRALEYTEQIEDEMYIPGSRIIRADYFSQIVAVKEEMAENGVTEYILIRFSTTPQNLIQVGNRLGSLLRATDLLGIGPDGELYLCLMQTNKDNIQVILDRIHKSGLSFREMDRGGKR